MAISLVNECIFIGIISVLCCIISMKIIQIKNKKNNSSSKVRNYMILSFLGGFFIHYIVKKVDLPNIYCKKVCYDDKCFYVCPVNY